MKNDCIQKRITEIDRKVLSLLEERKALGLEGRSDPARPGVAAVRSCAADTLSTSKHPAGDPGPVRRRLADIMAEILPALRSAAGDRQCRENPGAVPSVLDWIAF